VWTAIRTAQSRWEAELIEQLLKSQNIPCRLVSLGVESYLGMGSPVAVQVLNSDVWAALLLLSEVDGGN
jgi:hypothetical protein